MEGIVGGGAIIDFLLQLNKEYNEEHEKYRTANFF